MTQRLNLRILLQVSAVAIFFSIFPLVLERLIAQPDSWRIALWVYGTFHVIDVLTFIIGRPPTTNTDSPRIRSERIRRDQACYLQGWRLQPYCTPPTVKHGPARLCQATHGMGSATDRWRSETGQHYLNWFFTRGTNYRRSIQPAKSSWH